MDELRIPPEAKVLQDAYGHLAPRPSVRALAAAIGLSEGRVRQILAGYQSLGRGQRTEVVAPADTLARVALVLNVAPDELESAGRADAAASLRALVEGGRRRIDLGLRTRPFDQTTESAAEFMNLLLARVLDVESWLLDVEGRLRVLEQPTEEGGSDVRTTDAEKSDEVVENPATIDIELTHEEQTQQPKGTG